MPAHVSVGGMVVRTENSLDGCQEGPICCPLNFQEFFFPFLKRPQAYFMWTFSTQHNFCVSFGIGFVLARTFKLNWTIKLFISKYEDKILNDNKEVFRYPVWFQAPVGIWFFIFGHTQ